MAASVMVMAFGCVVCEDAGTGGLAAVDGLLAQGAPLYVNAKCHPTCPALHAAATEPATEAVLLTPARHPPFHLPLSPPQPLQAVCRLSWLLLVPPSAASWLTAVQARAASCAFTPWTSWSASWCQRRWPCRPLQSSCLATCSATRADAMVWCAEMSLEVCWLRGEGLGGIDIRSDNVTYVLAVEAFLPFIHSIPPKFEPYCPSGPIQYCRRSCRKTP